MGKNNFLPHLGTYLTQHHTKFEIDTIYRNGKMEKMRKVAKQSRI
jgi:hypothetical protein